MEAKLLEQGILGVVCLLLVGAVIALWRRNNAIADALTTALVNNTAALTALREGLKNGD